MAIIILMDDIRNVSKEVVGTNESVRQKIPLSVRFRQPH